MPQATHLRTITTVDLRTGAVTTRQEWGRWSHDPFYGSDWEALHRTISTVQTPPTTTEPEGN